MVDNHGKNRRSMLQELEQLSILLGEEDRTQDRPSATPAQTSLFSSPLAPSPSSTTSRPSVSSSYPPAMGENPFLPQHIRERLQGRNQGLAAQGNQPARLSEQTTREVLIERVLNSLRMEIEQRLYRELNLLDTPALQQLTDTESPTVNDFPLATEPD